MAMLNDNKTIINDSVWCRKFAINEDELERLLITLVDKGCIEVNKDSIFIPSCEKRLAFVRGGRNGGKKSKLPAKPIDNPMPKQIEKKVKVKEDTFSLFWEHYHKTTKKPKESKESALKYWNKLSLEEQRKAYTSVLPFSKTQEESKFLVKARTYLSDKRFNDEFSYKEKPKVDASGNRVYDFGDNSKLR